MYSTLEMIRDQFRRFVDEKIKPDAHKWHLKDDFIPMPLIEQEAELGVFGLPVPEEWGELGLGKTAMCLVAEELSRGYLSVGSVEHSLRRRYVRSLTQSFYDSFNRH